MESGTDTWVIVLAAFGGGLAGAILQPLTSYIMQRLQSRETIRKARQRSVRRMIFQYIRHTRRVQAIALTNIQGQRVALDDMPFWEPERIDDKGLHGLVADYNKASSQLFVQATMKPDHSQELMEQLDQRLNELQRKITARMDGLNYPEIDD